MVLLWQQSSLNNKSSHQIFCCSIHNKHIDQSNANRIKVMKFTYLKMTTQFLLNSYAHQNSVCFMFVEIMESFCVFLPLCDIFHHPLV